MNLLLEKKYGVPSRNFVKKNVLCEKGDEITRFDGNSGDLPKAASQITYNIPSLPSRTQQFQEQQTGWCLRWQRCHRCTPHRSTPSQGFSWPGRLPALRRPCCPQRRWGRRQARWQPSGRQRQPHTEQGPRMRDRVWPQGLLSDVPGSLPSADAQQACLPENEFVNKKVLPSRREKMGGREWYHLNRYYFA